MLTYKRFQELVRNPDEGTPEEKMHFQAYLNWKKKSDAAKRAVETKKRKYTTWPSRKHNHETK